MFQVTFNMDLELKKGPLKYAQEGHRQIKGSPKYSEVIASGHYLCQGISKSIKILCRLVAIT